MIKVDTEHSCSFTGHRPERLEMRPNRVISWLEEQIGIAVDDGYTDFVSGMQRGVDIWAAEIVLRLKQEGKPVRLICACAGVERQIQIHLGFRRRDSVCEQVSGQGCFL